MKRLIRATTRLGLAGAFVLSVGLASFALDDEQDEGKPDDRPTTSPERLVDPRNALQEEMLELFHEVERNLMRIDDKLAGAGAGEVPLEEVPDSGLDDLLKSAGEKGQQVVSDIDRILEIAEQLGGGT